MWKKRVPAQPLPKEERIKEEYRCINCHTESTSLFKKYSEGVIRLTDCKSCDSVVDKYIECDNVLLVIDLILQYIQAYRHLLFNVRIERPARLFLIFWFSNAYEKWIRGRMQNAVENIYDLELMFYKSLISSAIEGIVFIGMILLFAFVKDRKNMRLERIKFLSYSTLFGFYGNVAVVLAIVFKLADQMSYQIVLQIFLLASHLQVQRAIFYSTSFVDNSIVVLVSKALSAFAAKSFENL